MTLPHFLTISFVLIAFAGNSLLNRLALDSQLIDPISFAFVRIASAAVFFAFLVRFKFPVEEFKKRSSWLASFSLVAYVYGFSLAYQFIEGATGALILFSVVQIAMITFALLKGQRLVSLQWLGIVLAVTGFLVIAVPSSQLPGWQGLLFMVIAGFGWAAFSIIGLSSRSASKSVATGFFQAFLMSLLVLPFVHSPEQVSFMGLFYACLSGVVASGVGYWAWYKLLPEINAVFAGLIQLSVPLLVAVMGVFVLKEAITLSILISGLLIFSGIALYIVKSPLRKK